ncbi:hypothetical protein CKM354_000133800 [Cercospora kikuchii]|uniref:Uncharacterized protein n=1 Tax=Cercospora kikuchii TaxID=84275 RepID=A0A9P3C7N0_9PEZI|nr:uncharacterized protein CKM354_000133800 [Cercospora kikuchii]GIZ37909.1 hypothetical protein CKM354_000133800 [Cercospora kikuchii]
MAVTLQQIRHRSDTFFVPMNEVRSGPWSAGLQFLATEGLNGCTAVAVMSEYGAILAHIAPRTSTRTGDQDVRDLMAEVVCHFGMGRAAGLFPDATGIVLAAVHENEVALSDTVRVIKAVFERLGVPVRFGTYRVRGQGEMRARGETSIFIHGRSGMTPQTYVNDIGMH